VIAHTGVVATVFSGFINYLPETRLAIAEEQRQEVTSETSANTPAEQVIKQRNSKP